MINQVEMNIGNAYVVIDRSGFTVTNETGTVKIERESFILETSNYYFLADGSFTHYELADKDYPSWSMSTKGDGSMDNSVVTFTNTGIDGAVATLPADYLNRIRGILLKLIKPFSLQEEEL